MRKAAGCVLLAILCLLGASYLPRILQEAQTDREQQNLISGYIQNPDTTDEENTESTTDEPEEETDPNMERIVDFQNLQQINPEILAWITVPGTPIDYPVALGEDNSYYLNHTVTGESNILGSIFATAGTDFEESHIILYGHNMASGKMFGSLKKYHEKDFRNTYPCGRCITEFQVKEIGHGKYKVIFGKSILLDDRGACDRSVWFCSNSCNQFNTRAKTEKGRNSRRAVGKKAWG